MLRNTLKLMVEIACLPLMFALALVGRFTRKRIDVGLGPEPLINNIYHKKALERYGYSAQTFVFSVFHLTSEFDVRGDQILSTLPPLVAQILRPVVAMFYLYTIAVTRYRMLYIYFNGGPLYATHLLWQLEPLLYRLARVKVVVMAYGSDVQDMSRSPNLLFKHAMSHDYPRQGSRRVRICGQIDLWSKHADHIIGGCEWVDYMYHWDSLMIAHFSIDTDDWTPAGTAHTTAARGPIRILHAPNHRAIKGTQYFIDAVNRLAAEGFDIELVILEGMSNAKIRETMASVDIVADQLVVGWYAMFAIEAMAMEKPVLCYLREDLEQFYQAAGLLRANEIPIINCSPLDVEDVLRNLIAERERIADIGKRSRKYVLDHHSTEAIGKKIDAINRSLNVSPGVSEG